MHICLFKFPVPQTTLSSQFLVIAFLLKISMEVNSLGGRILPISPSSEEEAGVEVFLNKGRRGRLESKLLPV